MTVSDRSQVEVLLPLAAGLLVVGVSAVGLGSGATTLLDMAVFLALGTVLPKRVWRTAAIATAPGLVVGLVRAGSDSVGLFLVVVVASPLVIALSALLVKGGALLVARAGDSPSPTPNGPGRGGRRRKAFETKEQRGRFLVVLAILLVAGTSALSDWGAAEADRRAAAREEQIRTALAGRTPQSLQIEGLTGTAADRPGLPGGPYDRATLGSDHFEASVELRVRLQYRCIRVAVTPDGHVATDVDKGEC